MSEELDRASEELTRVFNQMSSLLFSEETLQSSLDLVSTLAHETISGTAGAGVTLIREGKKQTAAYSDGDVVRRVDDLQYDLDEGPCLSAIRDKKAYVVASVADDNRWPRWGPAASAMGLVSCMSTPLVVRDDAIGAVKVYSRQAGSYTERDQRLLTLFASQASIVLANALAYNSAQRLTDQLKEALESRDSIGIAKGILMVQERLDEEAAFDRLRATSQRENIKLRDVARRLVTETIARLGN